MDLLAFVEKVAELKRLKRTGWVIKRIADPESVADHSFSLALMAYVYSKKFGLNSGRCVKMALVHDICEVYAGDIPSRVRDEDKPVPDARKKELEENGLKKLIALLPKEFADEIYGLWLEFEARSTKEARLVKDLDKLEMCMQALGYAKTNPEVDLGEFFEDGRLNIKTPEIRKVFSKIHAEFKALAEKKRERI
jgi:putative hydrolase of HD superfamily